MIPRERVPYSAIIDRPPLVLPNRARLVVWTIVNLEFWDIARPMAAAGVAGADRPGIAAGRAELGVARIRDAGRRVALFRAVRAARDPPDPVDQCTGLRGIRAGRAGGARCRLGVHGPCLGADADPQRRGPVRDDQSIARHARAIYRHTAH